MPECTGKTFLIVNYKRKKSQIHIGIIDCDRSAESSHYFLSSVINISIVSKHFFIA